MKNHNKPDYSEPWETKRDVSKSESKWITGFTIGLILLIGGLGFACWYFFLS